MGLGETVGLSPKDQRRGHGLLALHHADAKLSQTPKLT